MGSRRSDMNLQRGDDNCRISFWFGRAGTSLEFRETFISSREFRLCNSVFNVRPSFDPCRFDAECCTNVPSKYHLQYRCVALLYLACAMITKG